MPLKKVFRRKINNLMTSSNMSKEYDHYFNLEGKNIHIFNDDTSGKSPSFSSFEISGKNRNIRLRKESRKNNNYNNEEENERYNSFSIQNIICNKNYL